MKRRGFFLPLVLVGIQTLAVPAQTPAKSAPGFALTLRHELHDGVTIPSMQRFTVRYTNTSKVPDQEDMCLFGIFYRFAVVLDGVVIPEAAELTEDRIGRQHGCMVMSGPSRRTEPGKYRENTLYYDMPQPGIYQVTVEVDSDPLHPENNVTVRSNIVTIVVPPPTPKDKK